MSNMTFAVKHAFWEKHTLMWSYAAPVKFRQIFSIGKKFLLITGIIWNKNSFKNRKVWANLTLERHFPIVSVMACL